MNGLMQIHHLAFRSHQLNSTIAFYRDVLGLKSIKTTPGYSIWFELGESILMIERAAPEEPAAALSGERLLALQVTPAELDSLTGRLIKHGYPELSRSEYTRYFRDPEGRKLGFSTYPR
jgi:catechol 2,3-dioxygenase-like lactoylglutathione lyase family enzyme